MSKFEELCQVYANARKDYFDSVKMREDFVEIFVHKMDEYFQCPIEQTEITLDEQGVMHFSIAITLYENPNHRNSSIFEKIGVSLTLDKIIDNYVVTVLPWGEEFKLFCNEFNKFIEVYEFIFEKIKDTYISGLSKFTPIAKGRLSDGSC
jgi:hypothetical protein